MVERPLLTQCN
uniref:Uncharacterized protein n=1 Tax=Lepeophtheirus salmonis TaxID=72036 RepID=A0A0K2UCN1_LEPSM